MLDSLVFKRKKRLINETHPDKIFDFIIFIVKFYGLIQSEKKRPG